MGSASNFSLLRVAFKLFTGEGFMLGKWKVSLKSVKCNCKFWVVYYSVSQPFFWLQVPDPENFWVAVPVKLFCNDYVPVLHIVSFKRVKVIKVLLRLFPTIFLFLNKFKNLYLIHVKLSKIWHIKNNLGKAKAVV